MNLRLLLEILISVLVVASGVFSLIGSIGLARMPDFFSRLHGPGKASTLGMLCALVAAALYFSSIGQVLYLRELLLAAFIAVTAPVSAYVLGRAALHRNLPGSKTAPPA